MYCWFLVTAFKTCNNPKTYVRIILEVPAVLVFLTCALVVDIWATGNDGESGMLSCWGGLDDPVSGFGTGAGAVVPLTLAFWLISLTPARTLIRPLMESTFEASCDWLSWSVLIAQSSSCNRAVWSVEEVILIVMDDLKTACGYMASADADGCLSLMTGRDIQQVLNLLSRMQCCCKLQLLHMQVEGCRYWNVDWKERCDESVTGETGLLERRRKETTEANKEKERGNGQSRDEEYYDIREPSLIDMTNDFTIHSFLPKRSRLPFIVECTCTLTFSWLLSSFTLKLCTDHLVNPPPSTGCGTSELLSAYHHRLP